MSRGFRLALGLGAFALAAASANAVDYLSPEIRGSEVTFRFYAPNARAVAVQGLRGRAALPMTRDTSGLWSLTVGDLLPDIHTYSFDVDGATALDPKNRFLKKWIASESAFEFAPGEPQVWSVQNVPHGALHRHTYASKTAGRESAFLVYTPPGYDSKVKYPVAFLFHGYGDDETAWAEIGRTAAIADNLIAKGACRPLVIVMTHGHPVSLPEKRDQGYGGRNNAAMEEVVLKEVLPLVESSYAVSAAAADRAIVGLSMGGGHALQIGLAHPEVFQWVGAMSSSAPEGDLALRFPELLKAAAAKRPSPRLLWIGIGKDDFLLERNKTFAAWLTEKQVPFTWHLTEGGHEWPVWRAYLAEFLPRLFR